MQHRYSDKQVPCRRSGGLRPLSQRSPERRSDRAVRAGSPWHMRRNATAPAKLPSCRLAEIRHRFFEFGCWRATRRQAACLPPIPRCRVGSVPGAQPAPSGKSNRSTELASLRRSRMSGPHAPLSASAQRPPVGRKSAFPLLSNTDGVRTPEDRRRGTQEAIEVDMARAMARLAHDGALGSLGRPRFVALHASPEQTTNPSRNRRREPERSGAGRRSAATDLVSIAKCTHLPVHRAQDGGQRITGCLCVVPEVLSLGKFPAGRSDDMWPLQ